MVGQSNKFTLNILLFCFITIYLFIVAGSVSSVVLYWLCSLLLCCNKLPRTYLFLFNCGLVIILLYLLLNSIVYGHVYFGDGMSDDFKYEENAEIFYNNYDLKYQYLYFFLGEGHNSVGYVYFLGLLFKWGSYFDGYNHLLPIIANIFFLQICAILLYKIAVEEYNVVPNLAKRMILVWSIYPSLIQISSYVFRDMLICMLILLIYYYVSLKKKFSFLVVIFCLFVLFFVREYVAVVSIILMLIIKLKIQEMSFFKLFVVFFLLCVSIIVLDSINLFDKILLYKDMRTETMGGIMGKIMSLPLWLGFLPRVCFLSITPMLVPNFAQFFAGFSGMFQFCIFPIFIDAFFNKKVDLKLKVYFIVFYLGVAFSTFTFRHITMFLPFAFLMITIYINENRISVDRMNKGILIYLSMWFLSISLIFV